MVLLGRSRYGDAYAALRSRGARAGVVVFVSADCVDSACAWLTLKALLRADALTFSAIPVAGYEDLQRRCAERLAGDPQAAERAVVLINCGGTEDVAQLLGLPPETLVVVLDSHRPIHLANSAESNTSVVVLHDERDGEPGAGSIDAGVLHEDSDGELSESDDEEESDLDEDDASDEEDDEDAGGARKRQRTDAAGGRRYPGRDDAKARRMERRRARAAYYARGTFFGRAAGCMVYDIAYELQKDSFDQHTPLWMSIVSLTDQYVHQRLTHESYTATVMELAQRVGAAPGADAPEMVSLDDGTLVKAFQDRRIEYSEEYRFMLLRHWSLYDAMVHSPYVASQLKTWRQDGIVRLQELLAEMGLPLTQCKQQFSHMNPKLLATLDEKLDEFAPHRDLGSLRYWSFNRSHGYKMRVSAADVAYGVTALLEAPVAGGTAWQDNFWRAVKALSTRHWDVLKEGIRDAKKLQKAIVQQGGMVLARSAVLRGHFRFINLGSLADSSEGTMLRGALALTKFAFFMQDLFPQLERFRTPKALVVAGPTQPSGFQVVVGIKGRPRVEDTTGNQFNRTFRQAAEDIGAAFRHDHFEASIIEIPPEKTDAFMKRLLSIEEELDARATAQAEEGA